MTQRHLAPRRGVSLIDAVATIAFVGILLAVTLPALAGGRHRAFNHASNNNLIQLGFGHALYAAEHNGRQVTWVDDEISTYGNGLNAFSSYQSVNGEQHPAVVLGWGTINNEGIQPVLFAYRCDGNQANASLTLPINFAVTGGTSRLGSFRLANTRPFRPFVSTRFYAPAFYSPLDSVVYPTVEIAFDEPWEYYDAPPVPGYGDLPRWSSYCMSPAAMLHPDVMANPDAGGWVDPWSIDHGFESPPLFSARYANLKTLMLEHHWITDAPADPRNPAAGPGAYGACEPYYFNHGMASTPNALFYDLSVGALANTDVSKADQALLAKTGYGLWSRDTPFGSDGYYLDIAYEATDLSHHIFTTDGILGRDTLSR